MTAVASVDSSSHDEARSAVRIVVALLTATAAVLLLVADGVQRLEASSTALLLRLTGGDATAVGTVVRVVTDRNPSDPQVPEGGYIAGGFTIASSCSVALFLAPLLVAGAALALNRRLAVSAVLRALAVVIPVLVVVSQLRFVVAGSLIRGLGQERGFSLAHILIGSVISTLGVVGGLLAFGWLLFRAPTPSTAEQP